MTGRVNDKGRIKEYKGKVSAIAIIFTTRKFISPRNGLSNKNAAKRKVGNVKVKRSPRRWRLIGGL